MRLYDNSTCILSTKAFISKKITSPFDWVIPIFSHCIIVPLSFIASPHHFAGCFLFFHWLITLLSYFFSIRFVWWEDWWRSEQSEQSYNPGILSCLILSILSYLTLSYVISSYLSVVLLSPLPSPLPFAYYSRMKCAYQQLTCIDRLHSHTSILFTTLFHLQIQNCTHLYMPVCVCARCVFVCACICRLSLHLIPQTGQPAPPMLTPRTSSACTCTPTSSPTSTTRWWPLLLLPLTRITTHMSRNLLSGIWLKKLMWVMKIHLRISTRNSFSFVGHCSSLASTPWRRPYDITRTEESSCRFHTVVYAWDCVCCSAALL